MVKIFKNNKGGLYVWLAALVVLFTSTFLWIIFSQVYVPHIFPQFEETMNATGVNTTETESVFSIVKTSWNYWIVVIIVGLIIWVATATQKREPDTGYY